MNMNYMNTRRFSTSTPPTPPVSSRTRPYTAALQRLSARTGTPLPSLIVSFAVLHELTVIVPLAGVFLGARAVGAGDTVVGMLYPEGETGEEDAGGWVAQTCRTWVEEGEAWAGRIGRRYGLFGFRKGQKVDTAAVEAHQLVSQPARLAGDVANAVLAYGVVKVHCFLALIPIPRSTGHLFYF
jgi:hypothetical protein